MKQKRRILFATTIAESMVFLEPLYSQIRPNAEVFLLFGLDGSDGQRWEASGQTIRVDIARTVAPKRDVRALLQIIRTFRKHHIDTVVYGTPKASLIVSVAAVLARIPRRVFVLHGLRYETLRGPVRCFMWLADAIAARSSTATVAVSDSVRLAAIDARIVGRRKTFVMGAGSVGGIDAALFRPPIEGEKESIRRDLGLLKSELVIGYVGRIARDKGIADLLNASKTLLGRGLRHRLLVIGALDSTDPVNATVRAELNLPNVLFLGPRDDVPQLLRAMDIFVLPSYREGLGLSALEASATGLPVVGTTVTGVVDAVRDGVTGVLIPARDPDALGAALAALCTNSILRRELGDRGRWFATSAFSINDRMDAWCHLLELASE